MNPTIVVVITVVLLVFAASLIGVRVSRRVSRTTANRTPEYLERYLDHVFSNCAQSGVGESAPFIKSIVEKYSEDHDAVSWGELFTVESYLLSKEPLPSLRRRAWGLRDKFREVVGQRQYDTYLLSTPPNENKLAEGDADLLRSDLGRLLDALHWSYALIPVRERIRAEIIKFASAQIVVWALAVVALVLVCAYYNQSFLATILFVQLAGALGGFLSLLRRIQMTPTTGDPLLSIFELENGRVSLYLAPLSGAIFALVLFFVFQAGLLKGALFPTLDDSPMRLSIGVLGWNQRVVDTTRINPSFANYGMLMVWSFIAGFAERLVPDTLARLVQRSEEASAETRTPPPAGQGGTESIGKTQVTGGGTLQISDIQPRQATPGSMVSIRGSGFGATQGAGTVKFNKVDSPSIARWSDTEIQAALPSDALGFVEVVLTLGNGVTVTSASDKAIAVE